MKCSILFSTVLLTFATVLPATAQKGAKSNTEAADLTEEQEMLAEAINNTGGAKSYHARAVLKVGDQQATIEGDLGVEMAYLKVREVTGKIRYRKVVNGQFTTSTDNGKTWQVDEHKENTIFLANVITTPVAPNAKIWLDEFVTKEEEIDGLAVVKMTRVKKQKSDGLVEFLLVPHDDLGWVVHRATMTITADDGEFPATVTYSKIGEPIPLEKEVKGAAPSDDDDVPPPPRPGKNSKQESNANDDGPTAELNSTIGALSAQGLIVTYMAVNTLGDAFAGEAVKKDAALQVLGAYENLTNSVVEKLEGIKTSSHFSREDQQYFADLLYAYSVVSRQIVALKDYINEGDDSSAAAFEKNRQKAKALIDEMFNSKK